MSRRPNLSGRKKPKQKSVPKSSDPKKPKRTVRLSTASQKSGTEFGIASASGAILRRGFREILLNTYKARNIVNRLNKRMVKIIRTAPATNNKTRKIMDANLLMLKSFQFNSRKRFSAFLYAQPVIEIEPLSKLTVSLPSFLISKKIISPSDYDRVVITTSCVITAFENKDDYNSQTEELMLDLKQELFPGGSIEFDLTGADNCLVLLAMCIHFEDKFGSKKRNLMWTGAEIKEVFVVKKGQLVSFEPEKEEPPPVVKPFRKSSWKINV